MIEARNKLTNGATYDQAETALCIWEYVLDSVPRGRRNPDDSPLYKWITGEQGVYAGRSNAIRLAHLVEHAYRVAHGDEHMLDGYAFDWELVPFVIGTWAEEFDSSEHIGIEEAEAMADRLLAVFKREG